MISLVFRKPTRRHSSSKRTFSSSSLSSGSTVASFITIKPATNDDSTFLSAPQSNYILKLIRTFYQLSFLSLLVGLALLSRHSTLLFFSR